MLDRVVTRTVRLPKTMADALPSPVTQSLMSYVEQGLDLDAPLPVIPAMEHQSIRLSLKPGLRRSLQTVTNKNTGAFAPQNESELIARLAYAAWQRHQPKPAAIKTPPPTPPGLPAPPPLLSYRPAQIAMAQTILQAVEARQIVGYEAATGTGKGLVLAAAAVQLTRAGHTVAVASPSHRIGQQTMRELARLQSSARHFPVYAQVRGRQEYVSDIRLHDYLADEDTPLDTGERKRLQAWAADQQGDSAWLQELLPDIPVEIGRLRLTGDERDDDRAATAYRAQYERGQHAAIVVASHAMISNDIVCRQRATSALSAEAGHQGKPWDERFPLEASARYTDPYHDKGLIAPYSVLLVDEAHDLAQMMMLAFTHTASLTGLWRAVRQAQCLGVGGLSYLIDQTRRLRDQLKETARRSGNKQRLRIDQRHDLIALLNELSRATAAAHKKVSAKVAKTAQPKQELADCAAELNRFKSVLTRANQARNGQATWLASSPVQAAPSIVVGPLSVAYWLRTLWERLPIKGGGGACVSATLYLRTASGGHSAQYLLRHRLNIPDKLLYPEPGAGAFKHTPGWVTDPVALHRWQTEIGASKRHPFTPPKDILDRPALDAWADRIARLICRDIAAHQRGGTLALTTSYLAAEVLGERLAARLPDPERLMVSRRGDSFGALVTKYKRLGLECQCPLWVATGNAWTGLDLTADGPADEDRLLTDLVITRLPFLPGQDGDSESAKTGAFPAAAAAQRRMGIKLRQAIGRLVRREGIGERHLWLLDPRASDPSRPFHQAIAGTLSVYDKTQRLNAL